MQIRLFPRWRRRRRRRDPRHEARRRRANGRRRLAALALVAAAAAAAGVAIGRDPAPALEPEPESESEPELDVSVKRVVGQQLMVRMETATDGLERQARRGEIGGVVLFPAEPEQVGRQVDRLQRAAIEGGNPPLLVAVDQEGAEVRRFPDEPPGIPPRSLKNVGGAAAARVEGRATGVFLKKAGVNVDLAPVLDVPESEDSFIFLRAYGQDAEIVAELGAGFIRGLLLEDVAPTAKHFPGLGRAPFDTDVSFATVSADLALIRADLEPFEAAIKAGVPIVMVASALYSAFDDQVQAVRSSRVVKRLRRGLGFDGVVMSDDLEAEAIVSTVTPADAALDASKAGVDLFLFARTGAPAKQAADRLERAAKRGDRARSALVASYRRIVELKDRFASPPTNVDEPRPDGGT